MQPCVLCSILVNICEEEVWGPVFVEAATAIPHGGRDAMHDVVHQVSAGKRPAKCMPRVNHVHNWSA